MWCGNGGSAADAQHMATELMFGLVSHNRKPIVSIALTTDTSFITTWLNDTDYDSIFQDKLKVCIQGDVLIAISTSGNSLNVLNAVNTAIEKRLKVIILTGKSAGKMKNLGDIRVCIPSNNTQRIQESHLFV